MSPGLPLSVVLREHIAATWPTLAPLDITTAVSCGMGFSRNAAAQRHGVPPSTIKARRRRVAWLLGVGGNNDTHTVAVALLASVLQRLQQIPGAPSSATAAAQGNASGEGGLR